MVGFVVDGHIYQVLFVFYSYPNDDTETATFDLTVALHVWLNDAVVRGSAVARGSR